MLGMSNPPVDTTGLSALASVIADIARRLISKAKPGISDLLAIVISDGGDIKTAIERIKGIPAEFLDIDTEEGQNLAALVKARLGNEADHTSLDEIIGEVFLLVPRVKINCELIRETPSWEAKADALGQLLHTAGKLMDLVHPPVYAAQ